VEGTVNIETNRSEGMRHEKGLAMDSLIRMTREEAKECREQRHLRQAALEKQQLGKKK